MAYKATSRQEAIQIEGLSQIQKALKVMGTPVEAIKEANKESGAIVARMAIQTARFKHETGALRRTIRVASVSTNVKIRAGMAKVPYANPIHWGWFRDKNTGVMRNILPNPFMSRALGYTRDEVLQNYVNNIQKLIDKATKGTNNGS